MATVGKNGLGPVRSGASQSIVVAFLCAVTSMLLTRLLLFVKKYAVDIFYSDQWDFYSPLFYDSSLWELFAWQHGPHRQGVGMLVIALLAETSGWDVRVDAYAVAVLLCLAGGCAYFLKHRLFGKLSFSDIYISLLFLSMIQYENIVVVPNISYAGFPLLLLMVYACCQLVNDTTKRIVSTLGLTFLMTFTGFGMFIFPLTTVVLLREHFFLRSFPKVGFLWMSLAALALIAWSFSLGYRFDPAIPGFAITLEYVLLYPLFVSLMLAMFFGIHLSLFGPFAIVAGLSLLTGLGLILYGHLSRLLKGSNDNRLSLVIVILISFTLLFCINAAVGRTPIGLEAAQANRYVSLMIPAFLGIYLHLLTIKTKALRWVALGCFLLAASAGSLPLDRIDRFGEDHYRQKLAWRSCYLECEDVHQCNEQVGNEMFLRLDARDVALKLAYMKEHHLGIYRDRAGR